jgi:hypothetical protein
MNKQAGRQLRAGAATAALWLTLQVPPPTPSGLGKLIAAGRRAAVGWVDRLKPEHEAFVPGLHARVERLLPASGAAGCRSGARQQPDPPSP